MKVNSLAFRWMAAAAALTIVVLPLAGLVISGIFRNYVEERFDGYIKVQLTSLVARSLGEAGKAPRPPAAIGEQLFEITHSGWYWQITPLDTPGSGRLVSASLASEHFQLPSEKVVSPDVDGILWADVADPWAEGSRLRVAERTYIVGPPDAEKRYSYAVAVPLKVAETDVANFTRQIIITFSVLGLGLLAATLLPVHFGLRPLQAIGRGLAAIRSGSASELEGDLPSEIEPLQRELNALIKSNRDIVERARTQVGNLAHALKTPLAVITNEAAEDKTSFSKKVAEQANVMRDQVNLYLDRARMAARAGIIGGDTEVLPVTQGLVRALERIYSDRGIEVAVSCPPELRFRGERQDLEEMLGNLMDNACKWAATQVVLTVAPAPGNQNNQLLFTVDDDGPGLKPEERQKALSRGQRLDESKPGSGLGLSIVGDLAGLYQGRLELDAAPSGGLRANLTLPQAVV